MIHVYIIEHRFDGNVYQDSTFNGNVYPSISRHGRAHSTLYFLIAGSRGYHGYQQLLSQNLCNLHAYHSKVSCKKWGLDAKPRGHRYRDFKNMFKGGPACPPSSTKLIPPNHPSFVGSGLNQTSTFEIACTKLSIIAWLLAYKPVDMWIVMPELNLWSHPPYCHTARSESPGALVFVLLHIHRWFLVHKCTPKPFNAPDFIIDIHAQLLIFPLVIPLFIRRDPCIWCVRHSIKIVTHPIVVSIFQTRRGNIPRWHSLTMCIHILRNGYRIRTFCAEIHRSTTKIPLNRSLERSFPTLNLALRANVLHVT